MILAARLQGIEVAMLPEWMGRGLAKRLIQAIGARARPRPEAICRQATVCQQAFLTDRAILLLCKRELIGFYERLGFVSRGPSASSHGGFRWYHMQLPIPLEATE